MSAVSAPWLDGFIADLPTPFDEADRIDHPAFARLCERQIAAGASAIVVCETSGEASTLSTAEQEALIRTAVRVARGRLRVIAGAGSSATARAIELTRIAEACGADAILSVVPYYNKPTQEGIHAHFRAISVSTKLPIILHDIPARTMRPLADDTLAWLCNSNRFAGLRDGTSDIARMSRLRALLPQGFRLLSGDDATAPAYVAAGGDGCISSVANIAPEFCRTMLVSLKQGLPQTVRHLNKRLAVLASLLSNQDPAAVKYALSLLGLMRATVRLPLVEPDDSAKAEIANAVSAMAEEDLAVAADCGQPDQDKLTVRPMR